MKNAEATNDRAEGDDISGPPGEVTRVGVRTLQNIVIKVKKFESIIYAFLVP